MDIKVFMLENISFILIIIISVVRSGIKDIYIYIYRREDTMLLYSMIMLELSIQSFNQFGDDLSR